MTEDPNITGESFYCCACHRLAGSVTKTENGVTKKGAWHTKPSCLLYRATDAELYLYTNRNQDRLAAPTDIHFPAKGD